MTDPNKLLSQNDLSLLQGPREVSWIPKNPRELLLPYISQDNAIEKTDLDKRKEKAVDVYNKYSNLINQCKIVEDEIKERCKNVYVTLKPSKHLNVIEALGRIFGIDSETITFEMYKICIERLDQTNTIPEPGDKQI